MISALSAIFISLVLTICFLQQKYNYWKKRNVVSPKPSLLLGNYGDYILQKKSLGVVIQDICQQYPDEPMIGVFYGTEPALIVQDPELLKLITTKDYYYFSAREVSAHSDKESDTRSLFFTYGNQWKLLRQNLTPLFTSAKMRNMFPSIESCCRRFESLLDELMAESSEQETKTLLARYTMDCICFCAYGIDANCMASDYDTSNPFRQIANLILPNSSWFALKGVFRVIWPSIFYALGLTWFSPKIKQFFTSVLLKVLNERKTSRNDMVDFVMKWKEKSFISGDSIENMKNGESHKSTLKVDDDLLVAQCVLFFTGGFETSSLSSTYLLFELAKNPEVQEKVLAEVDSYMTARGCLQYDCVTELPYLSQCLDEALRLYPLQSMLAREVYDDYTLNGVRLVKGDRIHLPILHLHRNPKFFPDPMAFRPERFSPENKKNIVPYSYMPLGEGPRLCIGFRFGKMQIMAGLVTLLKKYRIELADGMSTDVQYEPCCRTLTSTRGIHLKFITREGWEKRVFEKKTVEV